VTFVALKYSCTSKIFAKLCKRFKGAEVAQGRSRAAALVCVREGEEGWQIKSLEAFAKTTLYQVRSQSSTSKTEGAWRQNHRRSTVKRFLLFSKKIPHLF